VPKKLILHGLVQGVACRYYCSQYGKRLRIRGAVTNLPDGTVKVILNTSSRSDIERYMHAIRNNPLGVHFYGRIDSIDVYDYTGPLRGDYLF